MRWSTGAQCPRGDVAGTPVVRAISIALAFGSLVDAQGRRVAIVAAFG